MKKVSSLMHAYLNESKNRPLLYEIKNLGSTTVPNDLPVSVKGGYGWKMIDDPVQSLVKEFKFKQRWRLMAFVTDVMEYEDHVNHHGRIEIKYDKVKITVYTHDVDLVTELDLEYAKSVSEIRDDVEHYSMEGFTELADEY